MATERRLIDADKARVVAQRIYSDPVLIHTILNTLNNTPTVDAVEVVHGRWKNGTCTNCGQVDFSKPNYCPNCGADMRGNGNGR